MTQVREYIRTGRERTGYLGLSRSGMTVVFDNMMDGTACVTGNAPWQWDDVVVDLGMRQADLAHQSDVVVVRTVDDIHRVHEEGRTGVVFGLEAAILVGGHARHNFFDNGVPIFRLERGTNALEREVKLLVEHVFKVLGAHVGRVRVKRPGMIARARKAKGGK